MESDTSLTGLNVLLTRPARQASGITRLIEARGGRVSQLPLIEIEAIEEGPDFERIKSAILSLDNYAAAIFVSTNAASIGMDWIDRYWPQLPVGLEAYAVGPGTGKLLKQFSWPVYYPDSGITSEDLLALPGLRDVHGKRIALFRGQGGREVLAATLRERGAQVDYIEIYRRLVPHYESSRVLQQLRDDDINAVVTTSQQILEALLGLAGAFSAGVSDGKSESANEVGSKDKVNDALLSLLRQLPVIVPSLRVRELGRTAGIKQVIDAGGADDETVVRALLQLRDQSSAGSRAGGGQQ